MSIPGICFTAMVHVVRMALLVGAAGCAYCQVNSVELPTHLSPRQGVISKDDLLIPEKARKAMVRAQADYLHQRYESAQRDVQQAFEVCPHCALTSTFQGILDLQGRKFTEAAKAFQVAIEEDPSSGAAYLGLGVTYNMQGRFRDAIALFDRAGSFSPSSWLVHFEAASSHLGVSEYDAGMREITRAERFTGSDPEKLSGLAYLRGMAQCQVKDYAGGNRYFQDAVRRDPNGTFAMLARRQLERLGLAARDLHDYGADAGTTLQVP